MWCTWMASTVWSLQILGQPLQPQNWLANSYFRYQTKGSRGQEKRTDSTCLDSRIQTTVPMLFWTNSRMSSRSKYVLNFLQRNQLTPHRFVTWNKAPERSSYLMSSFEMSYLKKELDKLMKHSSINFHPGWLPSCLPRRKMENFDSLSTTEPYTSLLFEIDFFCRTLTSRMSDFLVRKLRPESTFAWLSSSLSLERHDQWFRVCHIFWIVRGWSCRLEWATDAPHSKPWWTPSW